MVHECFICGKPTNYKKIDIDRQNNKEYYVCSNCEKFLDILEPKVISGEVHCEIKIPLECWNDKVKSLYNKFIEVLREKKRQKERN